MILVGSVVLSGAALGGVPGAAEATLQEDAQDEGPDTQQTSYLRVVHASADAPAVDVAVDGETVVSGLELGETSDYLALEAGQHELTITTADGGDVVYQSNVTLDARAATTVAASGQVSEDAEQPFSPLFIRDDALAPEDGEAAVAVAHLSPDAPNVDITVEGSDAAIAENVSNGDVTDYVTVPEGEYTLEIREATENNNGSVLTTVDVSLEEGTAYTAYAVGFLEGAADDGDANETEIGNETETDNETDDGSEIGNETETDNESEANNESDIGNETGTDDAAQADNVTDSSFQVALTPDATTEIALPGEERGAEGNETAPGEGAGTPGADGNETAPGDDGNETAPGADGNETAPGADGNETAPGDDGDEADGAAGNESGTETPGTPEQ